MKLNKLLFIVKKYITGVLYFAVIVLLVSCSSKIDKNEATINLKVSNPYRDFVEFKKRSDPGTETDTIKLNQNGEAEIILKPDTLAEYVFLFGDEFSVDTIKSSTQLLIKSNIQEVILQLDKGYNLNISLDGRDIYSTIQIGGKGAELNDYLIKKEGLKRKFNLNYAELIKSDFTTYNNFIDDYRKSSEDLINKIPDKSEYIPLGFKENETKSLYFKYYGLKLSYANLNINRSEEDERKLMPESGFADFIKDIKLNNSDNLKIASYRQLVNAITEYMMKVKYRDSSEASLRNPENKYITLGQIFSGYLKDYMQFEHLKKNINKRDEDWYKTAHNDYQKNSNTDSLKKEIIKLKETREKLSEGKPAPNFSYPDINGRNVSLSDFKGKYLYIDIWATWCKPCIYEIPFLKKMEEDYKGRNIIFMSISIDEDIDKWKKTIAEKNLSGIQIIASDQNASIRKDYIISGIPRFIFISPEGEIINDNAPRPSDPGCREMIDSFSGL